MGSIPILRVSSVLAPEIRNPSPQTKDPTPCASNQTSLLFWRSQPDLDLAGFAISGPPRAVLVRKSIYHRALVEELSGGHHAHVGDLVLAAQKRYADTGAFPELLSICHLFADPALAIR